MNRNKVLLLVLLFAAISLAACSGPIAGTVCTVNCGGGNATVSFTLVADTLPANPSILSFKVTIFGITLTPTTGMAQIFNPNPSIVVDLMRLQSDTVFLGTLTKVPSGSYTVQVSLSSPEMTFLNDTSSTITANGVKCLSGLVCTATLTAVGTPTISSFTFNASTSGQQGIGIDFNLKNAISLSGGTLSVNFNPSAPNPGVFTAFALPRTNANLGTSQFELIEDFTGVVSISGSTVTITSPTRGTLTTTSTSTSFFDPSPDGLICPTPSTISCVVNGQIASVDAFLKSDGTLELKEFEPLNQTQLDFVEGTVYAVNSPTQFVIAVSDKVPAATNSLISGLNTGDRLTVNIGTQPFVVDSKGLGVKNSFAADYSLFANQTTTSAIHPGQTVALHVSAFTAANGTTLAMATVDTVILRWSRFRANVASATSTIVNIDTLPSYFAIPASTQEVVQAFLTGALGTDGVTNLDGVANTTSGLTTGQPVGLRVLYLQNPGNTANPAFFAAKIRQP
jgi:flagellin-like hook-associated protein FlgL